MTITRNKYLVLPYNSGYTSKGNDAMYSSYFFLDSTSRTMLSLMNNELYYAGDAPQGKQNLQRKTYGAVKKRQQLGGHIAPGAEQLMTKVYDGQPVKVALGLGQTSARLGFKL